MTWRRWALLILFAAAAGASSAAAPLRVHRINGLWHRHYRLDETLARLGASEVEESWFVTRWGFGSPGTWDSPYGSAVEGFPAGSNALARHGLVIVSDIDRQSLVPKIVKSLEAYAREGGTVLFLGGRYAFGKGYHGTALEAMAPVEYRDGRDLRHEPDGLPLAPGPDAPEAVRTLGWGAGPRVFWLHEVQPRPGARILLQAAGRPILVAAPCGKGTVAVFAGSVLGDPPPGRVPFWEWPDWPALLAALVRPHLKQEQPGGFTPGSLSEALEALALGEEDLPEGEAGALARRALPVAEARHARQARGLLATGHGNKMALGLRLLGPARDPDALGVIRQALQTGTVQKPGDDLMADPGSLMNETILKEAALVALGDLGTPEALAVLKTAGGSAAFAKGSLPESISPGIKRGQRILMARLRCGDAAAAGPMIDALLANQDIIARGRTWATSVPDHVSEARSRLPDTMAWQAGMLADLELAPASVLPALASRIGVEKDWRVTLAAFRAFGGKPLDDATRAALAASPVSAVAALGQ